MFASTIACLARSGLESNPTSIILAVTNFDSENISSVRFSSSLESSFLALVIPHESITTSASILFPSFSFTPFLPSILGILYAVNSTESLGSRFSVLFLSLLLMPLTGIVLLIYEYYTERRAMMYGTGIALFFMILFLFGLFTS